MNNKIVKKQKGNKTMYDLNKIFKLQEDNENEVIIKLIDNKEALIIAQYPFISSDMSYITVTKGLTNNLVIIKDDGTTSNFHFGARGFTPIGELKTLLKEQVLAFIKENNIKITTNIR